MKELKKQHLEMLQLLESIEVMFQNGNSIHPNSVIRGAIQTAIGMEVNVTNVNDKCDNKQTAVDWLVEQLNQSIGLTKFVDTCDEDYKQEILGIIEQAKAMEKEQSEFICVNVIEMILDKLEQGKEINSKEIFEDVYKQIFKSESFCNCPKGKGIDFDENQKAYCIDCGKNINL